MKNGWYIYKPNKGYDNYSLIENDCLRCLVCCGKQVVQVIEGEIWLTGVSNEYTVKEAKRYGKFKKEVKL